MKNLMALVSFLALTLHSCKKAPSDTSPLSGTYKGTFQRQTPYGSPVSNVTISFKGNQWTGESQFSKYPALCHGTFKLNENRDSITFENSCIWTAEFDWTLILGGTYRVKVSGSNIEISKEYTGDFKDVYELTK